VASFATVVESWSPRSSWSVGLAFNVLFFSFIQRLHGLRALCTPFLGTCTPYRRRSLCSSLILSFVDGSTSSTLLVVVVDGQPTIATHLRPLFTVGTSKRWSLPLSLQRSRFSSLQARRPAANVLLFPRPSRTFVDDGAEHHLRRHNATSVRFRRPSSAMSSEAKADHSRAAAPSYCGV
jgi:hypothetical protein